MKPCAALAVHSPSLSQDSLHSSGKRQEPRARSHGHRATPLSARERCCHVRLISNRPAQGAGQSGWVWPAAVHSMSGQPIAPLTRAILAQTLAWPDHRDSQGKGHGRPFRLPNFTAFIQPAAAGNALPAKARQTPEVRLAASPRPSPRRALAEADQSAVRARQPHDERAPKRPVSIGFRNVWASQPPCQGRFLQKFETGRKSPIPGCRFDLSDTPGPVNRACRLISPAPQKEGRIPRETNKPARPVLRCAPAASGYATPPRRSFRSSSTGHRALATLTYGENDHGKRTGIHHGNRHGL